MGWAPPPPLLLPPPSSSVDHRWRSPSVTKGRQEMCHNSFIPSLNLIIMSAGTLAEGHFVKVKSRSHKVNKGVVVYADIVSIYIAHYEDASSALRVTIHRKEMSSERTSMCRDSRSALDRGLDQAASSRTSDRQQKTHDGRTYCDNIAGRSTDGDWENEAADDWQQPTWVGGNPQGTGYSSTLQALMEYCRSEFVLHSLRDTQPVQLWVSYSYRIRFNVPHGTSLILYKRQSCCSWKSSPILSSSYLLFPTPESFFVEQAHCLLLKSAPCV